MVSGELVVSGCDASKVLEPAPHSLDAAAVFVGEDVVGNGRTPGGGRWDHRLAALVLQGLALVVGVVAPVSQQPNNRTGGLNERSGHGDLVGVAGAEQQPARSAGLIREAMELGRPPGGRRIPRRTQLIAASREVSKRQH